MKIILLPKQLLTADDIPFRRRKKDSKTGDFISQIDKDGNAVKDENGRTLAVMENAEFPRVLKDFVEMVFILNRLDIEEAKALKKEPLAEFGLEDSSRATDIIRAANVATNEHIELEKTSFEWLENKLAKFGVKALGLEAGIVSEIIKGAIDGGTTRPERRREEKEEIKAKEIKAKKKT